MICNEVIESVKTENKFKVALQRLHDFWKVDKVIVKSKQVIIKIFEENIMSLCENLDDSALATNILKERILR